MPVQPEHGVLVNRIGFYVTQFLGSDEKVVMGPEIGFIVVRNPDTVRAPDWSLTWREQAEARREGAWIAGGPNLAVEVVSPDDSWGEVQDKVDEYIAAGTQLVWVIDPKKCSVRVFRPDAPVVTLRGDALLTGDPVLPGFTLSLSRCFAL
jgi:Uma2 family endonuclease